MSGTMDTGDAAAIALALVAAVCDLRNRRIPNLLTFGGAAAAVVFSLFTHGASGLWTSLGGWLAGLGLFLPFWLLGGMGAGDVKLLACLGAWLGPEATLYAALYASVAGGAMAIAMALATGYLGEAVLNVQMLLGHFMKSGLKPLPAVTLQGSRGPRLPYALPIAAGAVAAIWLR
jgi:prepilin peptidase CpaA